MQITISLSLEEFWELGRIASSRADMSAEELLECFAGDLVGCTIETKLTGGSDERMIAHQWLDRRFGPEGF